MNWRPIRNPPSLVRHMFLDDWFDCLIVALSGGPKPEKK